MPIPFDPDHGLTPDEIKCWNIETKDAAYFGVEGINEFRAIFYDGDAYHRDDPFYTLQNASLIGVLVSSEWRLVDVIFWKGGKVYRVNVALDSLDPPRALGQWSPFVTTWRALHETFETRAQGIPSLETEKNFLAYVAKIAKENM